MTEGFSQPVLLIVQTINMSSENLQRQKPARFLLGVNEKLARTEMEELRFSASCNTGWLKS
ncbi:uncharacterized protein PHALS_11446 [Plasmopara halstedii]|uniref:Uncharacterized protein n=1 Tax=Plasmopara halstedii TaxID=4781 RepID=A0A0P1A608_PLAHL|nr:uncharacterized protein PHALS_11446 [Plasmopara halstedii]CEG35572.1 hypothetical protein PHALS_11446 [Plasmopara halstedii]|eukprot:XP_024571941.1 hypothetical protein PHALS_11446 [Plasmopara halstedii]